MGLNMNNCGECKYGEIPKLTDYILNGGKCKHPDIKKLSGSKLDNISINFGCILFESKLPPKTNVVDPDILAQY